MAKKLAIDADDHVQPEVLGGNLGYGLRYKLGYSGSIAAEKYQSYQCAR
jgi:hypothetical protein